MQYQRERLNRLLREWHRLPRHKRAYIMILIRTDPIRTEIPHVLAGMFSSLLVYTVFQGEMAGVILGMAVGCTVAVLRR